MTQHTGMYHIAHIGGGSLRVRRATGKGNMSASASAHAHLTEPLAQQERPIGFLSTWANDGYSDTASAAAVVGDACLTVAKYSTTTRSAAAMGKATRAPTMPISWAPTRMATTTAIVGRRRVEP